MCASSSEASEPESSTLAACPSSSPPCASCACSPLSSSIGDIVRPPAPASVECGLAPTPASSSSKLDAENMLLRRLVRADTRGCVGVAGESCGEKTTKSPCPCVGVPSVRKTLSSDEAAISPCPWVSVKARMGVTRAVVCAEGMTTLIVRERDGRVRATDEDGTGLPASGDDVERWTRLETVDILAGGVDRMEKNDWE